MDRNTGADQGASGTVLTGPSREEIAAAMTEEVRRVDLSDLVAQMCERLGLKANYVYRLDLAVDTAIVHLYKGRDGRCDGPKYVVGAEAARETITIPIRL